MIRAGENFDLPSCGKPRASGDDPNLTLPKVAAGT